jgi:hypothetical protein
MKEKLRLEIEKDIDDKISKVGVSVEIEITDGRGSNLKGSVCLIPECDSYQQLEREVAAIKEKLDILLVKSRELLEQGGGIEQAADVDEDLSAEEIWDILSTVKDPEVLLAKFNSMSHQKRLEVADYVLAHCNVFSGPASIFSMRYNSEEGLLE